MTQAPARGAVLLLVLLWLYVALGTAFVVWAGLGHGAAADSTFALPLPEAVMWAAGGVNLAVAFGGFRRLPATRPFALVLHAVVTSIALVVLGRHLTDGETRGIGSHVEMLAKAAVHAAMFAYWLRSRAVAERLRRA